MYKTMLRNLAPEFRYRVRYPVEYRLGLLRAGFNRVLRSGAGTIPFLIVSDRLVPTSEAQFAPLLYHSAPLRRQLGVVFNQMRLAEGMRLGRADLCRFRAIGLKLSFLTPEADAIRIVSHFREQTSAGGHEAGVLRR